MLATDPEVITQFFEDWAREYVRGAAEALRNLGVFEFHVNRDSAWQRVLHERLSTTPAVFFASELEEPRYRAAFHSALTNALIVQAETIAAAGDENTNAYDSVMKNALTRLIARADGFDHATISALRVLRRREANGSFSLLGLP